MERRLDEATDRLEWAPDPEAKELLRRNVRELERPVELAAKADPTARNKLGRLCVIPNTNGARRRRRSGHCLTRLAILAQERWTHFREGDKRAVVLNRLRRLLLFEHGN